MYILRHSVYLELFLLTIYNDHMISLQTFWIFGELLMTPCHVTIYVCLITVASQIINQTQVMCNHVCTSLDGTISKWTGTCTRAILSQFNLMLYCFPPFCPVLSRSPTPAVAPLSPAVAPLSLAHIENSWWYKYVYLCKTSPWRKSSTARYHASFSNVLHGSWECYTHCKLINKHRTTYQFWDRQFSWKITILLLCGNYLWRAAGTKVWTCFGKMLSLLVIFCMLLLDCRSLWEEIRT